MNSVCIATYNGEKFIELQLTSILNQLNKDDEIVVVDDNSNDKTVEVIKNFNDYRIKLFINKENLGHVKSFEKAISISKGDYIFLSDQDDYWITNRVKNITYALESSDNLLLVSNMIETDTQGQYKILKNFKMPKSSFSKNIYNLFISKSLYFGSLMCFKKELKKFILPFPNFIIAHDIYIAFMANSCSSIKHLDEILVLRTNTGFNQTYKKRSILFKIKFKFFMIRCFTFSLKYFRFE